MRFRIALAMSLLALVAASCGADSEGAAPGVGAAMLRYGYDPGERLSYDVDQVLDMRMTADGGGAAVGAFDADMIMDVTQRLDYRIDEGPQPDTIEVTIDQRITDGSATMTAMGQTEFLTLAELGPMASRITLVLDATGGLVEIAVDGRALPTDLFGDFPGLGMGSMAQPGHLGPEFPDRPVGLGDRWVTQGSSDTMGFEFFQRTENEITDFEEIDGRRTMRVDSVVTIAPIDMSFDDLMDAAMTAGSAMDPSIDAAQMDAAMEMFDSLGIEMNIHMDEIRMDMVSWFDPTDGIVVRLEFTSPMTMELAMKGIPDAGDITMSMKMDIEQTMVLVG